MKVVIVDQDYFQIALRILQFLNLLENAILMKLFIVLTKQIVLQSLMRLVAEVTPIIRVVAGFKIVQILLKCVLCHIRLLKLLLVAFVFKKPI